MSEEVLQQAAAAMEERFGAETKVFRDQVSLIVPPESILDACRALKDEFGFNILIGQSAVDYWPEEDPRFHIIYLLLSLETKERIRLRVPLSGARPSLPTLEGIYANANWYNAHNFYGDLDDVAAATLEDVQAFHSKYYIPNNAVLVIAGDFQPKAGLALAREYFEDIPAGPDPEFPDIAEPRQEEEKFFTKDGLPSVSGCPAGR